MRCVSLRYERMGENQQEVNISDVCVWMMNGVVWCGVEATVHCHSPVHWKHLINNFAIYCSALVGVIVFCCCFFSSLRFCSFFIGQIRWAYAIALSINFIVTRDALRKKMIVELDTIEWNPVTSEWPVLAASFQSKQQLVQYSMIDCPLPH